MMCRLLRLQTELLPDVTELSGRYACASTRPDRRRDVIRRRHGPRRSESDIRSRHPDGDDRFR